MGACMSAVGVDQPFDVEAVGKSVATKAKGLNKKTQAEVKKIRASIKKEKENKPYEYKVEAKTFSFTKESKDNEVKKPR